jgi:hypothetical protein
MATNSQILHTKSKLYKAQLSFPNTRMRATTDSMHRALAQPQISAQIPPVCSCKVSPLNDKQNGSYKISGFRRGVVEILALLGCYTV